MDRKTNNARFGAVLIRAVEEGGKTCINGLPLVPPTVRMLGRLNLLKSLNHESIALYLEMIKCTLASNMSIVISEHYEETLASVLAKKNMKQIEEIFRDVLRGLNYLHDKNLVHGNLHVNNVLVPDPETLRIRFSRHCIPFITGNGADAEITDLLTVYALSPERMIHSVPGDRPSFKSDVWSAGILLLQLYTGVLLEDIWTECQYFSVLLKSVQELEKGGSGTSLFHGLLQAVKLATAATIDYEIDSKIEKVLELCLNFLPSERLTLEDLFEIFNLESFLEEEADFEVLTSEELREQTKKVIGDANWKLHDMPIQEAFYLWKISGATPESILIKKGAIQLLPPITTVPNVVMEDSMMIGNEEMRFCDVSNKIIELPTKNLLFKINEMKPLDLYTSILLGTRTNKEDLDLTIIVKERDVTYQAKRMNLFSRILSAVSLDDMNNLLRTNVAIDVPPLYRGAVWHALLDVDESDSLYFCQLDTLAPHVSDRQLDVDIPRCHQYEELMTSPAAHSQLRKLLKAWLLSNKRYVYWQGCDSLAAPFLLLNFNQLDLALACLNQFIDRYLHNFFLKDNSAVIQEYLTVFNHLLAYTDAPLYAHLADLGFFPELYSIPWFLTCFAHVLPMQKIYHIWDQVMLHDSSFPLFIGLAIMRQLRPRLMASTFNDAILLFSDLPDLSMDVTIDVSLTLYEKTPPSCTFRQHDSTWHGENSNLYPPYSLKKEMQKLSVPVLKSMDCPRMSVEELAWRIGVQKVAVIDIRPYLEFARASLLGSINYPAIEDESYRNIANVFTAAQENGHPICIVWIRDFDKAVKFASKIVMKGICGICILDGGFEAVRDNRSLIHVPS